MAAAGRDARYIAGMPAAVDLAKISEHSSSVLLAWLDPGDTAGGFTASLAGMLIHDANHGRHLVGGTGNVVRLESSPRIATARNYLVRSFLAWPTEPRWLLMLDADMTFGNDLLDRLLATAKRTQARIVGGLCFAGGRAGGNIYPTLYSLIDEDGAANVKIIDDWPAGADISVDATGGACLLMHRSLFAEMESRYPGPHPWFAETWLGETQIGEDITFCLRARRMGEKVVVATGVELGHVKRYEVNQAYWWATRQAEQAVT